MSSPIYIQSSAIGSREIAADVQAIAADIRATGIYIRANAADSRESYLDGVVLGQLAVAAGFAMHECELLARSV